MTKLSDGVLIEELKKRFNENKRALHDLRVLTKKLELVNRKLQESEAMKSNFLSNIRNEIVNPLTSIMGLSEQVFSGDVDEETVITMAQMIHKEAFDLDFQLKNIFAAAELEAGESSFSVSNVDVVTLIENLIDSFSHQAKQKNLKVKFECKCPEEDDGRYYFRTDAEKLQIVLSNLLSNAIKYSFKGKQVKISAGKEGKRLRINVEDRGRGIGNKEKEKIFDRFRQLDSGVRKSHKGHGLGLSVTKALVEVLDGSIELSSVAGKGCVFSLSVPESGARTGMDVYSEDGNEFIFENEKTF